MKVLDLFSGIGGFSLGLDRAGFETVAFCEIEEYPRKILNKHWPSVPIAKDIKKLTYNRKALQLFYKTKVIYVGTIQLICGGFPCQPFSVAGKQAGKEDDRHLWPEMLRLIKEIKPRWVVGENVAGLIPMALDDVLSDLESKGYETQSFVIPACAVGGIHRRDRVWIVANAQGDKSDGSTAEQQSASAKSMQIRNEDCSDVADTERRRRGSRSKQAGRQTGEEINRCDREKFEVMANSINKGLQRGKQCEAFSERPRTSRSNAECCDDANRFRPVEPPTQSPIRHRNDGLPNNVARLKALGNAVVPQIPEMIGRAIMEIKENEDTFKRKTH